MPWDEASQAGTYIGEKTVINEFVAYADFGPDVKNLSHQTVVVVTFALAGSRTSPRSRLLEPGALVPRQRLDQILLGHLGAARDLVALGAGVELVAA